VAQKQADEAGSPAERKANEELLAEVAKQVFAAETALMESRFELEEAAKAYEPIRIRKAEVEKLTAELRDIGRKEAEAKRVHDDLANALKADSPRVAEAKKAMDAVSEKRMDLQNRIGKLDQSALVLPRSGGRGAGFGGGVLPEQLVKAYEKQAADEEAKRVAVERGESAVWVKKQKLGYLTLRQEELRKKLARVPAATKVQEAELEHSLAELRTLRELLSRVTLELNGISSPAPRGDDKLDRVLKELEDLRREVQGLRK
jgi:chromosome segregation ATPase